MYSQYGEDDLILKIFEKESIRSKALLDIGAWDPITFSNSRALIEAGWSATLFEPSPGPLRNLVGAYAGNPLVRVVSAAVTADGGPLELMVTDDAVSARADDSEHVERWKRSGGFYGRMYCPSMSLRQVFEAFGGDVEFVNFDTEGTSVSLFAEMCAIGPRPRVVCIEHDGRHVEIAQIAEAARYQQMHLNGTNVVLRWTGVREW
jgi:FkbM family methyltransferase